MREQQSRATQERHERLLNELFKVPGNNRCADCTSKSKKTRFLQDFRDSSH
jgi:stromal membrane-associated protein